MLEFLYSLTPIELKALHDDNINYLISNNPEVKNIKDVNEPKDKDISNLSQSILTVHKENNFLNMLNSKSYLNSFVDEIEIKKNFLNVIQNKAEIIKTLDLKYLKRSIILRNPKGQIDHFNLNYHPVHTETLQKLYQQIKSNYLVLEITRHNEIDDNSKFCNELNSTTLSGLARYLQTQRIEEMAHLEIFSKTKTINNKNSEALELKNCPLNLEKSIKLENFIGIMNNKLNLNEINIESVSLLTQIYNECDDQHLKFIVNNPEMILNFIYNDINIFTQRDKKNKQEEIIEDDKENNTSFNDSTIYNKKSILKRNEASEAKLNVNSSKINDYIDGKTDQINRLTEDILNNSNNLNRIIERRSLNLNTSKLPDNEIEANNLSNILSNLTPTNAKLDKITSKMSIINHMKDNTEKDSSIFNSDDNSSFISKALNGSSLLADNKLSKKRLSAANSVGIDQDNHLVDRPRLSILKKSVKKEVRNSVDVINMYPMKATKTATNTINKKSLDKFNARFSFINPDYKQTLINESNLKLNESNNSSSYLSSNVSSTLRKKSQ